MTYKKLAQDMDGLGYTETVTTDQTRNFRKFTHRDDPNDFMIIAASPPDAEVTPRALQMLGQFLADKGQRLPH